MKNSSEGIGEGVKKEGNRVLDKDLFLFFLDLEVKRARRYQNFLCLLLLRLHLHSNNNGWNVETCFESLSDLLKMEMRESDILGSLDHHQLVILLPYADGKAGEHTKDRLEDTLKYYDLKKKGFEVTIDQICFPGNGTDTMALMRRVLELETKSAKGPTL